MRLHLHEQMQSTPGSFHLQENAAEHAAEITAGTFRCTVWRAMQESNISVQPSETEEKGSLLSSFPSPSRHHDSSTGINSDI